MRLDLGIRLLPLTIAPFVVSWLSGTPLSAFGLSLGHPGRDLLITIPLAIVGFVIAAGFAEYLARRNRRWFVPLPLDVAAQSIYYIALNAPVEEWFFRGFLQGGMMAWFHSPSLAVLVSTAVFGGYHFLDRWDWRPVLGATVAGLALGLIYLWQPQPPSLLAPTLVHGAITCGFLSLGPYFVFQWRVAKRKVEAQPHLVRK
jgi:membrane protease YdiL (CAAX protease family)